MSDFNISEGRKELRAALFSSKRLLISVAVFSVFVNLLMLTGPLFMLNIYDRVLASNSFPTLYSMLALVTVLFLFMGALDHARARVLARVGARFQELLDRRVFDAVLRRSVAPVERTRPQSSLRDLETIQRVLASPAPFALFDMPWAPVFLAMIFYFHWTLGVVALIGGTLLMSLTLLNEWSSRKPMQESQIASAQSEAFSESLRREGETVQALGMRGSALNKWRKFREKALDFNIRATDSTGGFSATSKTLRFYLQSLILAVGAGLAIEQVISPGVMIAGSILMGRALAPVEQAIGQWPNVQRAMDGWKKLAELLAKTPVQPEKTELPTPKGKLEVQAISVVAPGERTPTLRNVSLVVEPGQALGVIGPSAAGKSTLARALTNIWRPAAGKIRLDGAALDQFPDDTLGGYIGYLPQDVALFEASVADNIARLSEEVDPEAVVTAAKRAGAHDMILKLPNGYDTPAGPSGGRLSGGQRQRIALARALYKDPPLLILDEPNSNLDALGEAALVSALKEAKSRGKTVVIMAHRPSAIAACDLLLMLEGGQPRAFGPKDQVLKETTSNYPQLVQGQQPQGQPGQGQQAAGARRPQQPGGPGLQQRPAGPGGPQQAAGGAQIGGTQPPGAIGGGLSPTSATRPLQSPEAAQKQAKAQRPEPPEQSAGPAKQAPEAPTGPAKPKTAEKAPEPKKADEPEPQTRPARKGA